MQCHEQNLGSQQVGCKEKEFIHHNGSEVSISLYNFHSYPVHLHPGVNRASSKHKVYLHRARVAPPKGDVETNTSGIIVVAARASVQSPA